MTRSTSSRRKTASEVVKASHPCCSANALGPVGIGIEDCHQPNVRVLGNCARVRAAGASGAEDGDPQRCHAAECSLPTPAFVNVFRR